jgi:hypothetical protein
MGLYTMNVQSRAMSRSAEAVIEPARYSNVRPTSVLKWAEADACSLSSLSARQAKTLPKAAHRRAKFQHCLLSHARDKSR